MIQFKKYLQPSLGLSFQYLRYSYFGSIKTFKLPDLGEKIKEATIKKIYVKEGDAVEEVRNIITPAIIQIIIFLSQFQTIADVATDKLFTQIPSSYSGKIHKVHFKEEDTCQVGQVFVEIEVDDNQETSKIVAVAPTPQNEKDNQKEQSSPPLNINETSQTSHKFNNTTNNDLVLATPSVRSIAMEHNISLQTVVGTGRSGRIMKEDIIKHIKEKKDKENNNQTQNSTPAKYIFEKVQVKMTDFQKGMQKSMTESNTIPHLYLSDDYDLTELSQMRDRIKLTLNQNITFMSFFIKAFSLALLDFPHLNSLYDINQPFNYTVVDNHNISLAVDSPNGLVVPNIKNVQSLSILDVQKELKRLVKSAEAGTLGPKDLFDGSICISNIGTIGGTYTGPLILPPQTTIVGLGRVQNLPKYINNIEMKGEKNLKIVPRKIMNVSFGCDHRVIDGASITKFSNKWRGYLEDPCTMLLHLK